VLPEAELAAVGPAAHQRVVGQDDHVAVSGTLQRRAEGDHHLPFRVRGARGRRVLRPGVAWSHHCVSRATSRSRSPTSSVSGPGSRRSGSTTRRPRLVPRPPLLPTHGLPAVGSAVRPVVIARDDDGTHAGLPDHVHLIIEPPLHLGELRVARRGKAGRVDVVAEEDHGRVTGSPLELLAEGDQDGLATLRRVPASPTRKSVWTTASGSGAGGGPGPPGGSEGRRAPGPRRRSDASCRG